MRTQLIILAALLSSGNAIAATPLSLTVTANPHAATQSAITVAVGSDGFGGSDYHGNAIAPITVSKFRANRGILLGATAQIDTMLSTRIGIATVPAPNAGLSVQATSLAGTRIQVGQSVIASGGTSAQAACAGSSCGAGPLVNVATETVGIAGSRAIASAQLATVYGNGSVAFDRFPGDFAVINVAGSTSGATARTRTTLGSTNAADNRYMMTYDYLNFARPVFANGKQILTLDFGTVLPGSGLQVRNASITNSGDLHSAGLTLVSISRTGNIGSFILSGGFADPLSSGASASYDFDILPQTVGIFQEQFVFRLEDYAPGGIGRRTYDLTINAIAEVSNTTASAVPEPATWAMLLAGFGAIGSTIRRQRRTLAHA